MHRWTIDGIIVRILVGDFGEPRSDIDIVVSTDDNYLTMGGGVARELSRLAASEQYSQDARRQTPVTAGTVVETGTYELTKNGYPDLKAVYHGTVIDYDSGQRSLMELIQETTKNCLDRADAADLERRRMLFPAFAAGSGGMSMKACGERMAHGIRRHVGRDSRVEEINILLWAGRPEERAQIEEGIEDFAEALDLVLGLPHDPTVHPCPVDEVRGRDVERKAIVGALSKAPAESAHVAVLGDARVGKRTILRAALDDLGAHRDPWIRAVPASFGRLHEHTPPEFLFLRLLNVLVEAERVESVKATLRGQYERLNQDADGFLGVLEQAGLEHVVFVLDDLPGLLRLDPSAGLWRELDKLQPWVSLVWTAANLEEHEQLLLRLPASVSDAVTAVSVGPLDPEQVQKWCDAAFARAKQAWKDAALSDESSGDELQYGHKRCVRRFVAQEGGRHPYTIALALNAIFRDLRQEMLWSGKTLPTSDDDLVAFTLRAVSAMSSARRSFLSELRATVDADEDLPDLEREWGLAIDVETDVATLPATITFTRPDDEFVEALLRLGKASAVRLKHKVRRSTIEEFSNAFDAMLSNTGGGGFADTRDAANAIHVDLVPVEVGRWFEGIDGAVRVMLELDDKLATVPWEVWLESGWHPHEGRASFRVGRTLLWGDHRMPEGRRELEGPIRALLIGDPNNDLDRARDEIEALRRILRSSAAFADPFVLLGKDECRISKVRKRLGSGDYDLVHYAGHSDSDDEDSGWLLSDGILATEKLANSLRRPPAFIFSNSCSSAAASGQGPTRVANESFDLPTAFLGAGVECFIGSLWPVGSSCARIFAVKFYGAFAGSLTETTAPWGLGECVRRAKSACRDYPDRDWLSFVLYGDPGRLPVTLFHGLETDAASERSQSGGVGS